MFIRHVVKPLRKESRDDTAALISAHKEPRCVQLLTVCLWPSVVPVRTLESALLHMMMVMVMMIVIVMVKAMVMVIVMVVKVKVKLKLMITPHATYVSVLLLLRSYTPSPRTWDQRLTSTMVAEPNIPDAP